MSSPLDRIEAEARRKVGKKYVTVVALSPEEALALVNVAKAAEETLAATPRDLYGSLWFDFRNAQDQLREALAALDKEPA